MLRQIGTVFRQSLVRYCKNHTHENDFDLKIIVRLLEVQVFVLTILMKIHSALRKETRHRTKILETEVRAY